MSEDRWVKVISNNGHIRGVAVFAEHLVREASQRHKLTGFAADALGEAMISALLLSSYIKGTQRINVNVQTTGLLRQVMVDSWSDGRVRGYVLERSPEDAAAPDTPNRGPWGEGLLSVLRSQPDEKGQPYVGTVPLVTGHLAKDMSYYWLQSEQVPSAVGLCVTQNIDGSGTGPAGGFLVQAMPDATAEEIHTIEAHIQTMPSLAANLIQSQNPMALLAEIFQSTPFLILEEKPLRFECQCSAERVKRALTFVGVSEMRSILKEQGSASMHCDFCAKEYVVQGEELRALIAEADQGSGKKGD